MYSSKLIAAIFMIGFLAACDTKRNPYFQGDSPGETQSIEELESQFAITRAQVETQAKELNAPSVLGIPERRRLFITVCLDNFAGMPIPQGLAFDIIAGQETISKRTRLDSCIRWEENHRVETNSIRSELTLRLKRTIVARNQYRGRRTLILYWNLRSNQFRNNVFNDFVPELVEDPLQDSFQIADVTATVQKEKRLRLAQTSTLDNEPEFFSLPVSRNGRLELTQLALTQGRLDQATPFFVDQHLNLYAQHNFQLNASPSYFVYSLDNPEQELNLPGGRYRVTLAFMDDPGVDFKKLVEAINQLKSVSSINQDGSRETNLIIAAKDAEKDIATQGSFRVSRKKRLLHRIMVGLTNSTVQFTVDHLPPRNIRQDIDVRISQFHLLDVRSVIAVSIENISAPAFNLKGHFFGYFENKVNPGNIALEPTPIEADKLHELYQAEIQKNNKLKPFDLFRSVRVDKDGFANLEMMSRDNLDPSLFPQGRFPETYPFEKELELFLDDEQKIVPYRKELFHRSLCHKVFLQDRLKSLDKASANSSQIKLPENQLTWASRCQSALSDYLSIDTLDFVDSTETQLIRKVGRSFTDTLTVSKSFARAISDVTVNGTNFEDSFRRSAGLNLGLNLQQILSFITPTLGERFASTTQRMGAAPIDGSIRINVGKSWFSTRTKSETSTWSEGFQRNSVQQAQLNVNIDTYRIKVPTRRCVIASLKPWILKRMLEKEKIRLPEGLVACSNKVQTREYFDKYFFITQPCSQQNGTTDCASAEETRLRTIIRGEELYEAFARAVENNGINIVLDPFKSSRGLIEERMQWTTLVDAVKTSQFFPGVFLAPPPNAVAK